MEISNNTIMWFNVFALLLVGDFICVINGHFFGDLANSLESLGLYGGHTDFSVHPEAVLSTVEILRYYGYPAETHQVITDDGYILEIHRIPGNKYNSTRNNRPPVLLQHGIISTSGCWLFNGIKDSLGFMLADDSYDVWLGNIRGNIYCRQHVSMSTEDSRFFKYNLDDHALSDLPAIIDYILKVTGNDKVTFIGHSLGATIGVLFLAGKPEYNDKINQAIFMAPVIYGKYVRNPLRIIGNHIKQFTEWFQLLGTNEISPFYGFLKDLANTLCTNYPGVIVCEAAIKIISGYDDQLFDSKRAHVLVANSLGGSSWDVILHFSQFFLTLRPARFDYGAEYNLQKYGKTEAPAYNFSRISTKVSIFYGYMDLYTDVKDIQTLAKQIKNLQILEEVPHDTWNHADFIWGINIRELFYERLVQVIKQFQ